MRMRLAVTIIVLLCLASVLAPALAQASECTDAYTQDVADCWARYSGFEYQLCNIEASARFVGCMRRALLGF